MEFKWFMDRCCDICNTLQEKTPVAVLTYFGNLEKMIRIFLETGAYSPEVLSEAVAGAYIAHTAACCFYEVDFARLTECEERRLGADRTEETTCMDLVRDELCSQSDEEQKEALQAFRRRFMLFALTLRNIGMTGEIDEQTLFKSLTDMSIGLMQIECIFGLDKAEIDRSIAEQLRDQQEDDD